MNDIDIANAFRAQPLKLSADSTTGSKSLWERMPIMMRKETKLGLAIGGVVLAVIVVWVAVTSGGSDKKQQANNGAGATRQTETGVARPDPNVSLEPVAGGDAARTVEGAGGAGRDATAAREATASAGDAQANSSNANKGDLDWGKLLNGDQPPMLSASNAPAASGAATQAPATPTQAPAGIDTPAVPASAAPANAAGTSETPAPSSSAAPSGEPVSNAPQSIDQQQATQNPQVAVGPAVVPQAVDSTATPAGGAEPAATPVAPEQPAAAPAISDSSTSLASGKSSAVAESTAPGKQRTHVVQQNETLSTISLAAYGSANYYPHILRANPGLDPKKMKVGQSIILPDISAVKPQSGSGAGAGAGAQPAQSGTSQQQQPAAATGQHLDPAKEYKVAANDSLYRISVKLYGKSDLANQIYELNKEQIGPDPAKLKLGTVLKLPSPPTVAQGR